MSGLFYLKDLFIHPTEQRAIELYQLLAGDVGQHWPALALVHQIPHRRCRLHSAPFVGHLGFIGDEVELPAPVVEAPLLDFMAAHEGLTWN